MFLKKGEIMNRLTLPLFLAGAFLLQSFSLAGERIIFSSGQAEDCILVKYSDGTLTVIDQQGLERTASINQIDRIVFDVSEKVTASPWDYEEHSVTFSSGQTVKAKVIGYSDGSITAIDEEGRERKVSIDRIEKIVFRHNFFTMLSSEHTPKEKALSPSEVLARADELEDESVLIEGNATGTESAFGIASDDKFVLLLDGDLRVEIGRDYFRQKYFELTDRRDGPGRNPFYEMRITQGGRSVQLIEKRRVRQQVGISTFRTRERTMGTESIMDSGEKVRLRGTLRIRGRRTYVDDIELLAIEYD